MSKKQSVKKPKVKLQKIELDADKFKEIVKQAEKSHEEISSLEGGILSNKPIDTSRMQNLWEEISWSEAPTLDKIANAPTIVTSDARRAQTQQTETQREESGGVSYTIASQQNKDQAQYIPSTQIRTNAEIIDTREIGRTQERQFNQQTFIQESSELSQKGFVSANVEKYRPVDRFDTEKAGRRDPLKRDNIKYEFKQSGA